VSAYTKGTRRRPARLPVVLAPEDRRTLDEVGRAHVRAVLVACHGNQSNAARVLGLDRKTLARRMLRWGVKVSPDQTPLPLGSLIAIEGVDGSGISTQATRLVDYLNGRGHRAILTSEPTTGDIGVLIRRRLAATARLEPAMMRTFSLLFAADRLEHFHDVVAPALASGTTVVSDRWYHSSLAYQRTNVEREWIQALYRHTRTPDVTLFLDVRPETGEQRRVVAGRTHELFHDIATQREVAGGYRVTIAELRAAGERIETIDGEASMDAVFTAILGALGLERRKRPR
jgi:dTMP kinase